MQRMQRLIAGAGLAFAGLLAWGSMAASAAHGPLLVPQGKTGGLQVLQSLRVGFAGPPGFAPYETVNGNPVDGGFMKTVTVGERDCRIVLRVQGRVQRSRPTTRALTGAGFIAAEAGVSGARHWTVGRQSDSWLALSWRSATPSTRTYGRYVVVMVSLAMTPPQVPTGGESVASERATAERVARRWVLVKRTT